MRSDVPPLAPTFRSRLQGELLALVLPRPDQEWSVSEIAGRLDAPLTTVQGEVKRLIAGDVLTSRRLGRNRMVGVNTGNPAVAPLTELALITFGPHTVIAEEFDGLGAEHVLIFGSWAARYQGRPGAAPADIDVLVIGDSVERTAMYGAAERAESRLGRPVNAVLRKQTAWADAASDPLLNEVIERPYVEVIGESS